MSDYLQSEDFIRQFQQEQATAFHAVYDKFFGEIYRFCSILIMEKHVAQDLTQDTLLKLFLKCKDFDSLTDIRAFLYVTARNACMDHFRYLKRVKEGNAMLKVVAWDSINIDDQLDGMFHQNASPVSKNADGQIA
jgi:DNA-directed RNA polymerase specialized sigma24 family protein